MRRVGQANRGSAQDEAQRARRVDVVAVQLLPTAVQDAACGWRDPSGVAWGRPAGRDRARPEGPRAVSWLGRRPREVRKAERRHRRRLDPIKVNSAAKRSYRCYRHRDHFRRVGTRRSLILGGGTRMSGCPPTGHACTRSVTVWSWRSSVERADSGRWMIYGNTGGTATLRG